MRHGNGMGFRGEGRKPLPARRGAPCGAPFLDAFWSGRAAAAAGAASRAPAVGRSLGGFGGRGGWTRGQLACAFEAVRDPGDRLERAVEEAEGRLGNVAKHVRELGLDIDT